MNKKRRNEGFRLFFVTAGVLLLCAGLLYRERQELIQKTAPETYEQAVVNYVIDGDTIIVTRAGSSEEERLRLIGIDCEESALKDEAQNTDKGRAAAAFTRNLLPEGTMVYLQRDVSETDSYDRLLRYVWLQWPENPLDEEQRYEYMVNAILLEHDMAVPMKVAPDLLYSDWFNKLYYH